MTNQVFRHFIPALFCAFTSVLTIVALPRKVADGWWQRNYFWYLPVCMVLVAFVTLRMQGEVDELRKRLADFEHSHGTITEPAKADEKVANRRFQFSLLGLFALVTLIAVNIFLFLQIWESWPSPLGIRHSAPTQAAPSR